MTIVHNEILGTKSQLKDLIQAKKDWSEYKGKSQNIREFLYGNPNNKIQLARMTFLLSGVGKTPSPIPSFENLIIAAKERDIKENGPLGGNILGFAVEFDNDGNLEKVSPRRSTMEDLHDMLKRATLYSEDPNTFCQEERDKSMPVLKKGASRNENFFALLCAVAGGNMIFDGVTITPQMILDDSGTFTLKGIKDTGVLFYIKTRKGDIEIYNPYTALALYIHKICLFTRKFLLLRYKIEDNISNTKFIYAVMRYIRDEVYDDWLKDVIDGKGGTDEFYRDFENIMDEINLLDMLVAIFTNEDNTFKNFLKTGYVT